MATAQHIIERAFAKIGVKATETPIEASEMQDGLDCLNDLLSEWDSTGALKGVSPVKLVSDTVEAPRYADGALKSYLAIKLANEYNRSIQPGMLADAQSSYNNMVIAESDNEKGVFPSTLPMGSGNRDGINYYDDFFPGKSKDNF